MTFALKVTGWPYTDGPDEVKPVLVALLVTVTCIGAEMLVAKFASPLYCAVSECVPAVNEPRDSLAAWLAGSVTAEPSGVLPSKNATEPVGAAKPGGKDPVPAPATSALSVIVCPRVTDVAEALKLVADAFLLTVSVTTLELLAA